MEFSEETQVLVRNMLKPQALGSRIFFSSILSIKCASTTYMNPFDMLRCEINVVLGKWGIVHKGVYFTTKHVKRIHICCRCTFY